MYSDNQEHETRRKQTKQEDKTRQDKWHKLYIFWEQPIMNSKSVMTTE